jgi:hypothetical protein
MVHDTHEAIDDLHEHGNALCLHSGRTRALSQPITHGARRDADSLSDRPIAEAGITMDPPQFLGER